MSNIPSKNRAIWSLSATVAIACLGCSSLFAQTENVPVDNPVYLFLDRLETRNLISGYHDAILPLSRKEIAARLAEVAPAAHDLSESEQGLLADFQREFSFELTGSSDHFTSLLGGDDSTVSRPHLHNGGERERALYILVDSSVTLFVNGLLAFDARTISGDALGATDAEYIQFGGRFRGTLFKSVGFFLQGTNAQFWGSRQLLQRDRLIGQAHTLSVLDTRNFDFVDGYLRYANEMFSAQIGHERILWGLGSDQKMIASDNVRTYDFIRIGAEYKSFQYTFAHAWLLGSEYDIQFQLPGDTTAYTEPANADKYFAAHRFEFTFPKVVDVGFQEIAIYSNRSPDLAYLNPLILIESAQRARGERDNVYWAFDLETHFLAGLQLSGTLFFDDIHLPEFFEPKWYNRYAYQASALFAEPLFFTNMSMVIEYTRVEPYVFSHNRSRENTYSSLGALLGPRIGPNADAWHLRLDWLPARRLQISARATFERSGENVYDSTGLLVKNVGGDFRQPHRPNDPVDRVFLDGTLMKRDRIELTSAYEVVHQFWLEGWYLFESSRNVTAEKKEDNHTIALQARIEF
jgi:hypothetical protein